MLVSAAFLILLALVLGQVCSRLRLPPLVGMLLAGIILGGSGLNILSPRLLDVSFELRQIALVIILMRAGLALDFGALRKVGRTALLLCFLPACFEITAIIFLAPKLLGISTLDAAIMGGVVAAVSPAVVVPKMLSLIEDGVGTAKGIPQMLMAGGSVDDLFVIVLFSLFTSMGAGGEFTAASLVSLPISIVLGLALGVVVGLLMVFIFRAIHLRDTLKLIILLSAAFLMLGAESALADVVALSGLLAVMAMGATVLSRYPVLARRISPKYSKVWILAEILLFSLVGASVNVEYAWGAGAMALLLLAGAMFWRMVGVYCTTLGSSLTFKERIFCMVAYMPKATVQAAIGAIPLTMGLGCGDIVLTMAVLSILITAPLGALGIDLCRGFLTQNRAGS